jgi:hypothetical protein
MAIHQAILPSVRLETLPKATVDIFITIIEADGIEGCIASGSIAASAALIDAGIEVFGLVVSTSAVRLKVVLDFVFSLKWFTGYHRRGSLVGSHRTRGVEFQRHIRPRFDARSRYHHQLMAERSDYTQPATISKYVIFLRITGTHIFFLKCMDTCEKQCTEMHAVVAQTLRETVS